MAKSKGPVGQCRLCGKTRTLRDSHFLPSGYYKHLTLDENGIFQNNAVFLLTRETLTKGKQLKKHLLCADCEGRFNSNGEQWVIARGYRIGKDFRLQDAFRKATPAQPLSNGWVYRLDDIHGVDWEKLAYFALSVFWRGAADSWADTFDEERNGPKPPFIEMDPALQEHLRRFLLGEADYPDDILLMLKISAGQSAAARLMSAPSKGDIEFPDAAQPQYTFMIPGIIFTLVPGLDIPEKYVKQGCLIRGDGHPVHMMSSDELFAREWMKLAVTAKPTQNVIEQILKKLKAKAGGPDFSGG
jgi:hypothetical protein